MDIRVLMAVQNAQGTSNTTNMINAYATNFGVKADTNKIESKVLGAGRWVKDTVPGRRSVGGDFELNPSISQLEVMLETGGFKKTSDTYKSSPFEKYLTLISDFQTDNLAIEYKDCLVNTLGITVTQEDYVSLKVGIIGMADELKDNKHNGNLQTVPTEERQLLCYGAILKQDNTDISAKVETVDININNSLEGKGGLNSRSFTRISQSGRGSVEVSIKFNAFDKENYKKALELLKNNESLKLELILKEDITTEEGNKGRKVEIVMPKVKLNSVDLEDLEGAGGLTRNLTALPDENGDPISFKIVEKTED